MGTAPYEVCAQQAVLDAFVVFSFYLLSPAVFIASFLSRFVVQQTCIGLGDPQVTTDGREVLHMDPRVKHPTVARLSDIPISPQPVFNVVAFCFSPPAAPRLT